MYFLTNNISQIGAALQILPYGSGIVAPAIVSLPGMVQTVIDRNRHISNDGFYIIAWTFWVAYTAFILIFISIITERIETFGAQIEAFFIQFISIVLLYCGEASATLATDKKRAVTLLLPIYIQVAMFQLSSYLRVSITNNADGFFTILMIHEAGGILKNCGVLSYIRYFMKRYFLGNLNAVSPYKKADSIRLMLIRGSLDAVCEIVGCLLLIQLVVIEILIVGAPGSNCILSCDGALGTTIMTRSNIPSLVLTLVVVIILRLGCLFIERRILSRVFKRHKESIVRMISTRSSVLTMRTSTSISPAPSVEVRNSRMLSLRRSSADQDTDVMLMSVVSTLKKIFIGESHLFLWIVFAYIFFLQGLIFSVSYASIN